MGSAGNNLRQCEAGQAMQLLQIKVSNSPSTLIPGIEIFQFHSQKGGLQRIESGIVPLTSLKYFLRDP